MAMRWVHYGLTLLSVLWLSACGLQLREHFPVPKHLSQLALAKNSDALHKRLAFDLTQKQVTLVPQSSEVPVLTVHSQSFSTNPLSLFQSLRTAEQRILLNISVSVSFPSGKTHRFSFTIARHYLDNPLNPLAKQSESELLKQEMLKEASQRIVRLLQSIPTPYVSPTVLAPIQVVD